MDLTDRQCTIEESQPLISSLRCVHNGIVAVRGTLRRLRELKKDYYLSVVTPAPPPPHERPWRHPSEVALGHRSVLKSERPTHQIRRVGTLSVTVGFLAVGLGLLWIAPESAPHGDIAQLSRTSLVPLATPIDLAAEADTLFGLNQTYSGNLAVASSHQVGIAVADNDSAAVTATTTITAATSGLNSDSELNAAMEPTTVTELTTSDFASSSPRLEVRLEDGTRTGARVVASWAGVALIELDQQPGARGRRLATSTPAASDVVVLLAERPRRVTYGQLLHQISHGGLRLAGGTPVVSTDGLLLGICVEDDQGNQTKFITAAELVAASAP